MTRKTRRFLAVLITAAMLFNMAFASVYAEGEQAEEGKTTEVTETEESGHDAAEDTAESEEPAADAEPAEDEAAAENESDGNAPDAAEGEAETGEEPAEGAADASGEEAEEPEAAEEDNETYDAGEGKYVQDVIIAYGKTEADAKKWLKENKWEPIKGNTDFNAGKASFFDNNKLQDQNVVAVMGIRRTDNANDAITDMAVMNMKGGYSFPDYEALIKAKKAEIKEFLNSFQSVIDEFRDNYNGKGSSYGKKRADLAFELLNRFYDGDPNGKDAVNDTGKKLGDLFIAKTMQEGNKDGADLEQIMLESSGPALLAVESLLAVAADTGKQTWLKRAEGLSGDELSKNLEKYVPEAKGQDIAPSAAEKFLKQHFGDSAKDLMDQWENVHNSILWYEEYSEENGLWQKDKETDAKHAERVEKFFAELNKSAPEQYDENSQRYDEIDVLYDGMYEIRYAGKWGETLGDFLNPAEGNDFAHDVKNFLPLAAALSEGQRASLDFVSLETLIKIGLGSEKGLDQIKPEVEKLFKDKIEMDVYTGVNRGAFRNGVALTSAALMEQNMGNGQAFDQLWNNMGIVAIASYGAACVGAVTLITGAIMTAKGYTTTTVGTTREIFNLQECLDFAKEAQRNHIRQVEQGEILYAKVFDKNVEKYEKLLEQAKSEKKVVTKTGVAGRWMLGIGGALLVGAAVVKGVQMWKYYQREMTPIPLMIVDESDIVEYAVDDEGNAVTDENGNQQKNVTFDTYEYYTAVKCNRPDVGEIGDWQSGVKEYQNHGCYDVADLNADMGQQWLALYTVKSKNKGFPILADSLTLQYGSKDMPDGCTENLHMFTLTSPVDIGDTAYAFNNEKNGIYFFWAHDEKAYPQETGSAFSGGGIAIPGFVGLIIGVAATAFVMGRKRKKDKVAENKTQQTA